MLVATIVVVGEVVVGGEVVVVDEGAEVLVTEIDVEVVEVDSVVVEVIVEVVDGASEVVVDVSTGADVVDVSTGVDVVDVSSGVDVVTDVDPGLIDVLEATDVDVEAGGRVVVESILVGGTDELDEGTDGVEDVETDG